MQDTAELLQARDAAHGPSEYPDSLPRSKARPEIDRAIRALVPTNRRIEIVALFDKRTTYGTIRHWRTGRRSTPQWALDLAAEKAAQIGALEPILRRAKTGPGKRINTRNIMAWHARNKDKKEKAPD